MPSDFEIMNVELGRGAQSTVVQCRYLRTGQLCALKRIRLSDERENLERLVSELHCLRALKHENVVRLLAALYDQGHLHIYMECVQGGSLGDFLAVMPRVPEEALGAIARQCVAGLLFLRERKVLHRDLKPSNILVSREGKVQIADFGMARQLKKSVDLATSYLGSVGYMSPERVRGDGYGFPSDVWSLGVILYQAAVGQYPFVFERGAGGLFEFLGHISSDLPVAIPGATDGLVDFLRRCLRVRTDGAPGSREEIGELAQHSWLMRFRKGSEGALIGWVAEASRLIAERDAKSATA